MLWATVVVVTFVAPCVAQTQYVPTGSFQASLGDPIVYTSPSSSNVGRYNNRTNILLIGFALPPRPEGTIVTGVDLVVSTIHAGAASASNLNLYSLPGLWSDTQTMDDVTAALLDPNRPLLQAGFITPANSGFGTPVHTSAIGSAAFAESVNAAYLAHGALSWYFVTIAMDNPAALNGDFYYVETNASPWNPPYVTLTFAVPAPGGAGLLGVALGAAMRRRLRGSHP